MEQRTKRTGNENKIKNNNNKETKMKMKWEKKKVNKKKKRELEDIKRTEESRKAAYGCGGKGSEQESIEVKSQGEEVRTPLPPRVVRSGIRAEPHEPQPERNP